MMAVLTEGGVLFLQNFVEVSIIDSIFTQNSASTMGGAISVFTNINNPSTLKITGCTFTNNWAPNGGAFRIFDSYMVFTESYNTYTNQTAINTGGVYYITAIGNLTIDNC